MSDTMIAVARKAYQAYVTKDRAAIEAVIDDDFHFSSPLDNRLNRKTYFDWCWKNSEWITGFNFINLVPDGERVFVTYEGQSTTGKRFRGNTDNADGKIVEVEVYFGWSIPHELRWEASSIREPKAARFEAAATSERFH